MFTAPMDQEFLTTIAPNKSSAGIPEVALSFRYFGISIAFFAIFVGTIGNFFTILAYFSNKKLQTTFNLMVVNLSMVDFITASLMLPFNLAGYVQTTWPFGKDSFTARLQAFSYFSCGYTSVVFLVAITVNRFIGVFWPTKYDTLFSTYRKIFLLIFCWTFAPILLLPFLVGTDPECAKKGLHLTGFRSDQLLCTFTCLLSDSWKTWMQVTRVLFQFIPLAIMIILYLSIFLKLQKKAKNLERSMTRGLRSASLTSSAVAAPSNGSSINGKSFSRKASSQSNLFKTAVLAKRKSSMAETRRAQNNKRMLMISVVICIAFMFTFLPSVIVNLLPGRSKFDPRIHMMASNLSWFNSSLNPIVYVILNPRFRKEYIRLIKFLFGKTKGTFVHESSTTQHQTTRRLPLSSSKKGSFSCSSSVNYQSGNMLSVPRRDSKQISTASSVATLASLGGEER